MTKKDLEKSVDPSTEEGDIKMKDKPISEEELLDELDTMYQRVADIEKEEAAEVSIEGEAVSSSEHTTRATPENPFKKKTGQNKRRLYRPIILAAIAIIFAFILAITFWKPMAILQLLKIGDTQQPTVVTPPSPRKPPSVVTPPAPPTPLTVATSPTAPPSPSVAPSPAAPKPASEMPPVQTKQEALKKTQEEVEKPKSMPQEITKPSKPLPQSKYYAIQVGAFSDMENVRELVEAFKKEGLEAYWITMKSRSRGTLYRVLVGHFTDENEAVQFLKDKKILKNYPDSFVKEVSSSKINP
jgi:cell division septation protein DedD